MGAFKGLSGAGERELCSALGTDNFPELHLQLNISVRSWWEGETDKTLPDDPSPCVLALSWF